MHNLGLMLSAISAMLFFLNAFYFVQGFADDNPLQVTISFVGVIFGLLGAYPLLVLLGM